MGKNIMGTVLASLALVVLPNTAVANPPFLPIHKQFISLPQGVLPYMPTWTPDGRHILFQHHADGRVWITGEDGKGTKCITCGFADQPAAIDSGFTYAFPDGKRILRPHWPPFTPDKSYMIYSILDSGPRMEADPRKERLDLVERVAEAPLSHSDAERDLGGTSWQLVQFQGSDDKTLTPDDKTKYTIAFGTDGRVSARFDCNRGRGTWTSSGPHQLQFGPLALTRVMCPPGSLHDRITRDWELVRSYTLKDGHLFLSLMADGGIYEFEPIGR